jgi:hemerythrin
MHSFTFGSQHETGNKMLDSEHKQLYQLVRECSSMALNGVTCEYLMAKLNDLYTGMEAHFRNEERMMDVLGIKQTEMHRNQHLNQLVTLKKNIINFSERATRINSVQKVLVELLEWYETHIEYEDKKLALLVKNSTATGKKLPVKQMA